MTLEDLARRVGQLEARNAITELVTRYAIVCDEHDIDGLEQLFTHDAVFDSPSGVMQAQGRAAIRTMFEGVLATRGPGYHWTHDNIVRFDAADPHQATGLVLSHAETTPNGVVSLAAMKYDDVYRFEDGAWRFASRNISFLYYVPAQDYTQGLNSKLRLHAGGTVREADYPEKLPVWQAFEKQYVK